MTKKPKSPSERKASPLMKRFTELKRALATTRTGADRRVSRETLNLIILQLPLGVSPFALGEQLILEGQRAGSFEAASRLLVGVARLLAAGRDVAADRAAAGGESQAARLAAVSRTVKKSPRRKRARSKASTKRTRK